MYNKFNLTHTNPMNWEEFNSIVSDIIDKLKTYQKENNIKFDITSPVLRSGGVPAVIIANKLQIVDMSPVQIKCTTEGVKIKTKPAIPIGINADAPLNILVIETNTCTGKSAKKALSALKQTYPNSKFYYVSVCKVYESPNIIEGYENYTYGIISDDSCKLTKSEAIEKNIRYGITIFPWETAEFELAQMNNNASS